MASRFSLHSFTDMQSYSLPCEVYIGNLRTDLDFIKIESMTDSPKCVIRCLDKENQQREVVLKYIDQVGGAPCLSTETFREITILKSLDHNNIIKLFEVLTVPETLNRLCLVMEYCPYSVARYIDEYPRENIPHDEIKYVAKQLFAGLKYLHQNYIIHRDIKPDNLMLTKDGVLKIIDFGLSRRFTHNSQVLTPDVVTMHYQAPELLLQAPTYDNKVDMWSAGCVLGELFKRKPILPGHSQIDQIKRMTDLIGMPNEKEWPGFVECGVPKNISFNGQPYNRIAVHCECSDAIDILKGLLKYNPESRFSAEQCLDSDWLEKAPFPASRLELPKEILERPAPKPIEHRPHIPV